MPPMNGRNNARYDEDDDFDGDPSRRSYQNPTNAGLIGSIAAIVSLGLLAVVVVLYIFLQQEEQRGHNDERERWMYYWFLILDVVAFFAALTATVAGGRGMAPSNPVYRGWAIAALVLGIIEMLITVGFGFFMTCSVLILEVFRRPGG